MYVLSLLMTGLISSAAAQIGRGIAAAAANAAVARTKQRRENLLPMPTGKIPG
jgi:hypothetical protein